MPARCKLGLAHLRILARASAMAFFQFQDVCDGWRKDRKHFARLIEYGLIKRVGESLCVLTREGIAAVSGQLHEDIRFNPSGSPAGMIAVEEPAIVFLPR